METTKKSLVQQIPHVTSWEDIEQDIAPWFSILNPTARRSRINPMLASTSANRNPDSPATHPPPPRRPLYLVI